LAKLTVHVPSFSLEIEGAARDEMEAWTLINDYHAEEFKQSALDKAKITRAVYDKGE